MQPTFSIQLVGGPLADKTKLVPELRAYYYFRLSSGKWTYYYLAPGTKKPAAATKTEKLDKDDMNFATAAKGRSRSAPKRKRKPIDAQYLHCRHSGEVDERNSSVQTFINWHVKTYGKFPSY